MARINITFGFVGGPGGVTNHPPLFRASGPSQTITSAPASEITAAVAESTGYGEGCAAARIYSDVGVWYTVGRNPVAVAETTQYLPAGGVEYIYVTLRDRIAVLEA